jgi:TetR/AcrR family transcriptional repressor of bet genes
LIEGAIWAIAEKGFGATTVLDIARNSGFSHGLINFHFDSKAALFDAVMDHLADEFRGCWEAGLSEAGADAQKRLSKLALSPLDDKIASPERLAVWFAFWGEASARTRFREVSLALERAYTDALFSVIEDLPEAARPTGSPETLARLISAAIDSLWFEMHLTQGALTAAAARKILLTELAVLFPELYSSPPDTC